MAWRGQRGAEEAPEAAVIAESSAVDDSVELAVIQVQSAIRGHATRYRLREAKRLEWLRHYTEAGEWEEAEALTSRKPVSWQRCGRHLCSHFSHDDTRLVGEDDADG